MNKKVQKLAKFSKYIFSGIIGASIFFVFALMLLAATKLIFLMVDEPVQITMGSFAGIIGLFALSGFVYGCMSYAEKNKHYQLFSITPRIILVDFIFATLSTWVAYVALKGTVPFITDGQIVLVSTGFLLLCYGFSALSTHVYVMHKRNKKIEQKNLLAWFVLNPLFIVIYLWFFGLLVYDVMYVPCGATVTGYEENALAANTRNFDLIGQTIVSVDYRVIKQLKDLDGYLNSLASNKEILVETNTNTYYIDTYTNGDRKHLGLTYTQAYCDRP